MIYLFIYLFIQRFIEEPTEAEKIALERERRRIEAQSYTEKRMKSDPDAQMAHAVEPYNRVHRLATDLDPQSLGNRMFMQDKKSTDVFPDLISPDIVDQSLSRRLMREDPTAVKHLPTGARSRTTSYNSHLPII